MCKQKFAVNKKIKEKKIGCSTNMQPAKQRIGLKTLCMVHVWVWVWVWVRMRWNRFMLNVDAWALWTFSRLHSTCVQASQLFGVNNQKTRRKTKTKYKSTANNNNCKSVSIYHDVFSDNVCGVFLQETSPNKLYKN